jgi:hypothetical protein
MSGPDAVAGGGYFERLGARVAVSEPASAPLLPARPLLAEPPPAAVPVPHVADEAPVSTPPVPQADPAPPNAEPEIQEPKTDRGWPQAAEPVEVSVVHPPEIPEDFEPQIPPPVEPMPAPETPGMEAGPTPPERVTRTLYRRVEQEIPAPQPKQTELSAPDAMEVTYRIGIVEPPISTLPGGAPDEGAEAPEVEHVIERTLEAPAPLPPVEPQERPEPPPPAPVAPRLEIGEIRVEVTEPRTAGPGANAGAVRRRQASPRVSRSFRRFGLGQL